MQCFLVIVEAFSNIDIEEELTTCLCMVIALLALISFRKSKLKKSGKLFKQFELHADQGETSECDAGAYNNKHYVQTDKALRTAFEQEDYWKVLKCWKELKHFHKSSIHLSMIIRSMRFCNKGAYFIATELKDFFKTHPQEGSIGLINDLLEPLSRRPEDAQLVELLGRMPPSINLSKDSRTYEILLTMHAANRNLDKAQEMMVEMKTKEIVFTPRATVAIMTMGLQMGDSGVVLNALIKLQPSWDERSTWAVSMFAVERHKTNILMQIVTLACQEQKVCDLSMALDGMIVPEEVLDALLSKLSLLSDIELGKPIAALDKSGQNLKTNPIYIILVGCLKRRSNSHVMMKSSPPWKLKKLEDDKSSSSTSDGSRSDSDEDIDSSSSRSMTKSLAPWRVKQSERAGSSASTSEGSRSDSEEESHFGPSFSPVLGLVELSF